MHSTKNPGIGLIHLLICSILFSTHVNAQKKDYWKVFFPDYIPEEYHASVDIDQNLNLALNNINTANPNKFISLNKDFLSPIKAKI